MFLYSLRVYSNSAFYPVSFISYNFFFLIRSRSGVLSFLYLATRFGAEPSRISDIFSVAFGELIGDDS